MERAANGPDPFSWTRTRDGVIVLRFHPDWPVDGNPESLLRGGLLEDELPVLFDLREAKGDESRRTVARFLAALPSYARRAPQRRAYLVRRAQQREIARLLQFAARPLHFEASCFPLWDDALDWLRGVRAENGGVPEGETIE